jgi:hypothetical protein
MKMSFFFGISKGVPVGTAHGSTGTVQQPEWPLDEDIQKNRSGGMHQHPKISGFYKS